MAIEIVFLLAIILIYIMSEANLLIDKLEQGVDTLISKVSSLNELVKNQKDEISELNKTIDNYKEENLMLTENVSRLKLKLQTSNSDSEKIGQYKEKIDKLVNEIDSCISLLNR